MVLQQPNHCIWLIVDTIAGHPTLCRVSIQAVATGHAAISSMCNQLTEWAAKVGKKQKRPERLLPPAGLDQALKQLAAERVEAAYRYVLFSLGLWCCRGHF
eukprot:GHRR01027017.1.p1 GENE.GHRR01027017.1~~GHRR01027017.1.p1  ORF type:complete len:101 (+),score=15.29 GHRR01027017.1:804-1106(+)